MSKIGVGELRDLQIIISNVYFLDLIHKQENDLVEIWDFCY